MIQVRAIRTFLFAANGITSKLVKKGELLELPDLSADNLIRANKAELLSDKLSEGLFSEKTTLSLKEDLSVETKQDANDAGPIQDKEKVTTEAKPTVVIITPPPAEFLAGNVVNASVNNSHHFKRGNKFKERHKR